MDAQTYAVWGASGGVGASTTAAQLARRLGAAGRSVVLVDGDTTLGAADLMCGVDHLPGLRWPELAGLRGAADGVRIVEALPRTAGSPGFAVLAGAAGGSVPPGDTVAEVVASMRRASYDVVVDAGRPGIRAVMSSWGVRHLLVTGLGIGHLSDLERSVAALGGVQVGLLTRGGRWAAGLGRQVAEHVGLDWLGHVREEPRIRRALERGGVPPMPRGHPLLALPDERWPITSLASGTSAGVGAGEGDGAVPLRDELGLHAA